MTYHPAYYTTLLQRRLDGDLYLTDRDFRELDLHLLGCPVCNFIYLTWLHERDPERADSLLRGLQARLQPQQIASYIPELAQALHAPRALSGFEVWLWDYVQAEPALLAQLRVAEARLLTEHNVRDD